MRRQIVHKGTMGDAPDAVLLVETEEDAEVVVPPQTERLAYVTQTTLSVDDTAPIVEVLRRSAVTRLKGSSSGSRSSSAGSTRARKA